MKWVKIGGMIQAFPLGPLRPSLMQALFRAKVSHTADGIRTHELMTFQSAFQIL